MKPAAFLPANDGTTSVIRHGTEPREELWEVAERVLGDGVRFHGAAVCRAGAIRLEGLNVVADEPPPRHANVIGWPVDADPEMQKARRKEIALVIAAQSMLVLRDA